MPASEPAPHAALQPPGIGGKLHRLGSGQQHAEIECMQEPLLVEPFLSSTSTVCMSAIWPAGPPKDKRPIRPNTAKSFGTFAPY